MAKNPLLDEEFLKELYMHRSREIFSKIIALTLDEDPVEEIQGQVTGGSITLDGTSNVRRTCNLTMVANEIDINQYYWGLKNKFKLYIGLANNVNKEYDDIIWFPMGIYVISNFATSQSTNNYTISITGKDKMCLLNGELSGSLFATVDFGKEEYYDGEGTTTITPIPIKNIIREAVHAYAEEKWENIIINDLDDYGIELLDYRGSIPMYLYFTDGASDNTKECEEYTLKGDTKVYPANRVYNSRGGFTYEVTNEDGVTLNEIETTPGLYYDPRITLDLNGVESITPSIFCAYNAQTQQIDTSKAYTIARILNGQTCGYRLTDITYPGDLILGIGETITAMLDKIVNMLGNFEYFYDVDGRFIFQRKATFVDKTWNNIRTGNQNSYVTTMDETYVEAAAYITPIFWTFGNSFLTTAYSNTPALSNVRNDFSIWGTKKSITGTELPVHLRYAVDKKPTYYKTIEYTITDDKGNKITKGGEEWTTEVGDWCIDNAGNIIETEDLEYLLTGKEDYTEEERTAFFKQNGYRRVVRKKENLCDWREIIFQMALDYRRHNHEDDFYLKVRNTNGLDLNGQWYYPSGKTGYEQYYTDMEGFWRQLYCPVQLMGKLFPPHTVNGEEQINNPKATGTWGERPNGVYYNTGAIAADTDEGIYFSTSSGIMYNVHKSYDDYSVDEWVNSWVNEQNSNDGWNVQIIDSPETLNFWFDFLEADNEASLSKYSVPAIGDRSKSINDNMVKAIYFRETPTALFTSNIQTVERKSGYTYLAYSPEMGNLFNVSSQGKSAIDVMKQYINLYLYCAESISITSVPIYHLQPNVKVLVYDEDSKINGQYLVSRITIPLAYNGTMSVTATKSAEIIY